MDTVRADHLGCYGYHRDTTPNIDKYAAAGTVFTDCTSPSSWTVPAHLTMFTSLEPATHQCVYYSKPARLNDNYETIAKTFTRNGFKTAAFTGGGYAGDRHGMDIGFQRFETNGSRFEHNMKPALAWLDDVGDQPFFMFLHGFNAHRPYVPPTKYARQFSGEYKGSYDILQFAPGKPTPVGADLDYVISQYDGEIAFVDAMMGDFFEVLNERGLLNDTLIVLTSDHGDEFYEHGGCDHIRTLYSELVQVPWIMFGPGVPVGRVDNLVGTIDLFPTVRSLFGFEALSTLQGTDRTKLLHNANVENDAEIYSFTGKGKAPKHLASIRTKRWKLVVNMPAGYPHDRCPKCLRNEPEGKQLWLFDLKADPGEHHNIAAENAEVLRSLYAKLKNRIAESGKLRLVVAEPPAADPEYLERLRGLGYIGEGDEDD